MPSSEHHGRPGASRLADLPPEQVLDLLTKLLERSTERPAPRRRRRRERLVLTGVVVLAAGLAAAFAPTWGGREVPTRRTVHSNTMPRTAAPALPQHRSTSVPPARISPAKASRFVLTAARGPCYLQIRAGSANGRTLFEGVLARGASLRFSGARVWLRAGAAGNVDVAVNGTALQNFPQGTVDVVLTASGISPRA